MYISLHNDAYKSILYLRVKYFHKPINIIVAQLLCSRVVSVNFRVIDYQFLVVRC